MGKIIRDYDIVQQILFLNKVKELISFLENTSYFFRNDIICDINYKVQQRYIKIYAKINEIEGIHRHMKSNTMNGNLTIAFIDTYNLSGRILPSSGNRPSSTRYVVDIFNGIHNINLLYLY